MPRISSFPLLRRGSLALVGLLALGACDSDDGKETADAKPDTAPAAETKTETKAPEPKQTPPKPEIAATPVSAQAGPDGATPIVDPQAPVEAVATPAVIPPPASARTQDEQNSIAVFDAAAPATVFVTQTQVVHDWSMRTVEVPAGAGTGFIWDAEGHIVTNCHVALADCRRGTAARKLTVTLFDQKTYDAELIGSDPYKDIAVLKISAPDKLIPIRRVPKGETIRVGQKAVAIGNPFGLDHTLTVGVISAMDREVQGIGGVTIRGMVQTDAAINPGNSGGPLLDSQGQLIGMNTMIFSNSGSSAGIGFAVPHSVVERVVPQIIKDGRPTRIGLGVSILGPEAAAKLGVDGVVVDQVRPSSPAGKAGLRSATRTSTGWQIDVIVGVDGERVKSYDDLYNALEAKAAGDKVTLSVLRVPGEEVVTIETDLVEL